ncbi:hypothetical protein D3C78_1859110 [compost metagenome]
MRGQSQLAVAVDAQAFALDAVQALGKQGEVGALAEQGQTAGEQVAQDCIPLRIVRPNMGANRLLYKGGAVTANCAAAVRSGRGTAWLS